MLVEVDAAADATDGSRAVRRRGGEQAEQDDMRRGGRDERFGGRSSRSPADPWPGCRCASARNARSVHTPPGAQREPEPLTRVRGSASGARVVRHRGARPVRRGPGPFGRQGGGGALPRGGAGAARRGGGEGRTGGRRPGGGARVVMVRTSIRGPRMLVRRCPRSVAGEPEERRRRASGAGGRRGERW